MSNVTDVANALGVSSKTVEKHCVFCGQRPVDKNKEHVIPDWAIRMSGDPKRECTIHTLSIDSAKRVMRFSFDQLQFPACTLCNSEFSDLEGQAKGIVERMLARQPVSATELSVFLDWMDKVRVGLWLGIRYLDLNSFPIDPNFYIAHRIGTADRVACLMLTDAPALRLTFSCVSTIAFRYQPSSFALCINGLSTFNASTDFLIARRMGLPHPHRIEWDQSGMLRMQLQAGAERVMRPPLRAALPQAGTWLYQPMVRPEFVEAFRALWDTDYARHAFWDLNTGFGAVFVGAVFVGNGDGSISLYPQERSNRWLHSTRYASSGEAIRAAADVALKIQMELLDLPSVDRLPKERQKSRRMFDRLVRADLRARKKSLDYVK